MMSVDLLYWLAAAVAVLAATQVLSLFWLYRQEGRLRGLEGWSQQVELWVQQQIDAVVRAVVDQKLVGEKLKAQEYAIEQKIKEATRLMVALTGSLSRTTDKLRDIQISKYGNIVRLPTDIESLETREHPAALPDVTDHSRSHPATADADPHAEKIDLAHLRSCCECYAHSGPLGSRSECNGCPPWSTLHELCIRLRGSGNV